MSKEACKCKEVECEECPEWIFTLADLIMCMMGLFVLLWVLKPSPNANDSSQSLIDPEVVAKIREAFEYLPDPQSNDPIDKIILMRKLQEMKPLKGPGDGGKTKLERKGAEGESPEVLSIRRGNQALVGSRVLFDVGSDKLAGESRQILDQIAMLIKGHRNIMLIRGHTSLDDFTEGTDAQQKLDLSIRRAKTVADYLVSRGVEPDILRVLGCSTFEPLTQRAYSTEARQMNRRVEVESTTLLVPELLQGDDQAQPLPAPATSETSKPHAAPAH